MFTTYSLRALAWIAALVIVYSPLVVLAGAAIESAGEIAAILASSRVAGLFLRSLALALGAAILAGCLGTVGAIGLEGLGGSPRVRRALRLAALVAVFLPPYFQVAIWRPLLGDIPARLEGWRFPVTVAFLGVAGAPLVLCFASVGLRTVRAGRVEAARLLGTSRAKVLRRVLLPSLIPSVLAGSLIVFLVSLLDYEVPALLFLPVFAVEVFVEYSTSADLGRAVILALPLLTVACAAAGGLDHLLRGAVIVRAPGRCPRPGEPIWPVGITGRTVTILVLIGMVIWPLGRLLELAGTFRGIGAWSEVFALHRRSVVSGLWTSLCGAGLAVALALAVVPRGGRVPGWLGPLTWLPLVVPGSLLGAAIIRLANRPWLPDALDFYESPAILVFASVSRFFPVAFHALAAHLRSVPRNVWESADLLGPRPLTRFLWLWGPLASPGLALAGIAFLVVQGMELSATVLVAPPGHQPPAVTVYSLLHYNRDLEVPSALCLVQFGGLLVLAGLVWLLGRLGASRLRRPRGI